MELHGRASEMRLVVSKPEVRFGECESGGRSDVPVRLTNMHPELPVSFTMLRVAQFKVRRVCVCVWRGGWLGM